jgi:hypothetical protein
VWCFVCGDGTENVIFFPPKNPKMFAAWAVVQKKRRPIIVHTINSARIFNNGVTFDDQRQDEQDANVGLIRDALSECWDRIVGVLGQDEGLARQQHRGWHGEEGCINKSSQFK